jgi:solute carrier family 25 (adenine nucleotide translocator) protein 4/5/6/31
MFAVKHNIQADVAKQAKDCNKFVQSCIAGGTAGAVALGLFYPLDLVRNRVTLDTKILNKPQRLYAGITDAFTQTLRTDGILGLYRGLVVSLVGVVVYRGLFFGLYDHFKGQVFHDKMGFFESFVMGYGK